MKIKGEEFIPIKDVMALCHSAVDDFCFNELGNRIKKFGIYINEEQLKKWVKQAQFIERFSLNDIRDAATRNLVYNLQTQNKELEEYKVKWQKLIEFIKEKENGYCYDGIDNTIHIETLLNKMQELEKE